LIPVNGITIKPLLERHFRLRDSDFTLSFLSEVILLARGPLALVAKDKSFLSGGDGSGLAVNMTESFRTMLSVKVLKKKFPHIFSQVPKRVLGASALPKRKY